MGTYGALTAASIKNKMSNLWWNIRCIPIDIEISSMARKAANDPKAMKELKRKCFGDDAVKDIPDDTMSVKETEKAAKEMHKASDEAEISPTIKTEIVSKFDDEIMKNKMIKKGIDTQKLIDYAFFFMQDERAALIKRSQTEKEIINGIAAIFGFPKIYESAGVGYLNQYDMQYPQDYMESSKFLLSIADIKRKLNDPCFMERIKNRMEAMNAEAEYPKDDEPEEEETPEEKNTNQFWKVDEDQKIVKPFFTGSGNFNFEESVNSLPAQGLGISDELFNKLEETVGSLCEFKHRYERCDITSIDLVKMFINRGNGIEEAYIIDPGIVMGLGKIYVLCNTPDNDTLFVSTDHADILKEIFKTAFNCLTVEQIQLVVQDYFRNMRNYRYIDMNNTEKLAELSPEDFQKLGKKLTYILNQVANQMDGCELPRFRFNYWNGIDDFIIISDPGVLSPMSSDGTTSPVICEGLMFEVKGDDITQRYMGSTIEYHIDKYGDL